MSLILFAGLAVMALAYTWVRFRTGVKDDMIVVILCAMALALAACGNSAPAPAPTHGVDYGVDYSPQHVHVTLHVKGSEQVRELTLRWDRELNVMDYPETCISMEREGQPLSETWLAFPHGSECVLRDPGTSPLTEGTYTFSIRFGVRRHISEPALDMDMTPTLQGVSVTNTIEIPK